MHIFKLFKNDLIFMFIVQYTEIKFYFNQKLNVTFDFLMC